MTDRLAQVVPSEGGYKVSLTDAGRLRLLEIFEREGLLPALVEGAMVLSDHGQDKHGTQGWRGLPSSELRDKAHRHIDEYLTPDVDSGREHSAHAFIRCMQLCARALGGDR